jgi:hypothetical protein
MHLWEKKSKIEQKYLCWGLMKYGLIVIAEKFFINIWLGF